MDNAVLEKIEYTNIGIEGFYKICVLKLNWEKVMGQSEKSYRLILDAVDKRIPSVFSQKKQLDEALSFGGDWRSLEDADRVQFRLNQLSMNREAACLMGAEKSTDVKFNILERIIKANELMPVSYLYKGADVARTVGRINIRTDSGIAGYGTGFLISPRLMMTNQHVLDSLETAEYSQVEMNFRDTPEGFSESSFFRFLPHEFFELSEDLDFALVAVEAVNQKGEEIKNYGYNQIIKESGKALVGEHVNIIQHPSAEPKQIAIRQNRIIGKVDNFLHYVTDTQQGSSGSPVYNDNWELVALHHAGKPARNKDGSILLVDGSVWDGGSSSRNQILWEANEGVRISGIFKYLDSIFNTMVRQKQMLYRGIFTSSEQTGESVYNNHRDSLNCTGVKTEADGSTSLFLRVNVKVDSPGGEDFNDDIQVKKIIGNSGFSSELYYDEQSDKSHREDYYRRINFEKGRDSVFTALSLLLKETHTKSLSYRSARIDYLYPYVDRREYGKLKSIYSGTLLEPEDIISRELKLIKKYEDECERIIRSEYYNNENERNEAIENLEASLQFNCEHVVPQSWFDKRSPMRSDLHHLFTCESQCNSFRSNIPYWQFNPLDEAVRSECGRRENDKFEPENGHGAVARATLYFLLRYPEEVGNGKIEMQSDRLDILLDWHRRDPVSLYELHRNSTISSIQGNRNPLVDYPHMVDNINFLLGFKSRG